MAGYPPDIRPRATPYWHLVVITGPLPLNHWYLVVIAEGLFKHVHVRLLLRHQYWQLVAAIVLECCLVSWYFHRNLFPVKRRWTNINDSMEAVKFITTWNANWVIHYIIFVKGFRAIFMMSYHSTTHYTARKSSFGPKKPAVFLMYWARKVILQKRTQWYNAHLPQPISCKIAIFHISSKWNYSISRWHLRALISL